MTAKDNSILEKVKSIASILIVAGMIATPIIYVVSIKTDIALAQTTNKTQDEEIATLQFNSEYSVKLMETVAEKNHIDADSIRIQVQKKMDFLKQKAK